MSEPAELRGRTYQSRGKSRRACLFVLVAGIALCVWILRQFNPSDWVEVNVGPLPEDTKEWCLVAQDSKGVDALPWYASKVFPFTMSPFEKGHFAGRDMAFNPYDFTKVDVQWKDAERYGILIRLRNSEWRLRWIKPDQTRRPSFFRYVIPNSSAATLGLRTEDQAEIPSPELLKKLGWTEPVERGQQ